MQAAPLLVAGLLPDFDGVTMVLHSLDGLLSNQ